MNAGPARRFGTSSLSEPWSCRHVLSMHVRRERLGEDFGRVVVGVDLAHFDAPVRHVLAHLQVSPVNVPRALAHLRSFDSSTAPLLSTYRGVGSF
eukprot:4347451-Pleurochrysis_carterae.AAC.1